MTWRGRLLASPLMAASAVALVCGCGAPPEGFSPEGAESLPDAPVQRQAPLSEEARVAGSPTDLPVRDLADPGWVVETAEVLDVPARALEAYAGAALRQRIERPDCGLGWNTLAGIGQVESRHGSYGGSSLGEDGTASPPIIGIALDGSEGVAAIPDTDGGELDGDDEWDRAVGPMQFIPTTWEIYAQGGSRHQAGGSAPDPQNIDDAARTAAVFLCERGGEVATDDGFVAAVGAYNRSVPYINDVARWAADYAGTF
ncbi:lytic transglycosylase domain-containing protein [Nesterenkonia suensis]